MLQGLSRCPAFSRHDSPCPSCRPWVPCPCRSPSLPCPPSAPAHAQRMQQQFHGGEQQAVLSVCVWSFCLTAEPHFPSLEEHVRMGLTQYTCTRLPCPCPLPNWHTDMDPCTPKDALPLLPLPHSFPTLVHTHIPPFPTPQARPGKPTMAAMVFMSKPMPP